MRQLNLLATFGGLRAKRQDLLRITAMSGAAKGMKGFVSFDAMQKMGDGLALMCSQLRHFNLEAFGLLLCGLQQAAVFRLGQQRSFAAINNGAIVGHLINLRPARFGDANGLGILHQQHGVILRI